VRIIRWTVLAVLASAGIWWWFMDTGYGSDNIYPYQSERDRQAILQIFSEDWQWLVNQSPETYSAAYRLDYKAPSTRPQDVGKMNIAVYRLDGDTVGFVTYHTVNFYKGFILFLAVKREYRGRGVAYELARHAIEQLRKRGVSIVELYTRSDNYGAQHVYERLGFEQVAVEDGYVKYHYLTNVC